MKKYSDFINESNWEKIPHGDLTPEERKMMIDYLISTPNSKDTEAELNAPPYTIDRNLKMRYLQRKRSMEEVKDEKKYSLGHPEYELVTPEFITKIKIMAENAEKTGNKAFLDSLNKLVNRYSHLLGDIKVGHKEIIASEVESGKKAF